MQTSSSGGVAVDLDALLRAGRALSADAAVAGRLERAVARALDEVRSAAPGPVGAAAGALDDVLPAAVRALRHAQEQLAADASTQAWRAAQADGR